jgi:diguanylate cyclase (GGDEF)-like protein
VIHASATVVEQGREVPPGQLPLAALIGAVATAAVALISLRVRSLPDLSEFPGHRTILLLLMAAGFAAAEVAVVYVPVGRSAFTLTLNEIPLVVGLFVLSPGDLVAARVVGALVPLVLRTRDSPAKLAFNIAHYSLEVAVLLSVWYLVLADHPPLSPIGWAAIGVAVVATDLMGMLLISLAIAASTHRRPRLDAELVGLGPLPALVNASFALTLVYVISVDWRAIWTLGVIVSVLFSAQRAHHTLRRRNASLEQLTRFTGEIGGRLDVESAAAAAVVFIARAMSAETVELSLHAAFGGRTRHWVGNYDGATTEPEASGMALAISPWLSAGQLLVPRGIKDAALAKGLRAANLRDAVAMQLTGEEGVIGTLIVGDRLGNVETFHRADLRELQALGNHLAVSLQNARRADLIGEQAAATLYMSLHDPLTGLPNRRGLEDHLHEHGLDQHGLEQPGPDQRPELRVVEQQHSLVLLNLDRFKEINDTLGYPAGDILLGMVGARLAKAAPGTAVLARVGGDEFALLLPRTDSSAATGIVGILRHSLSMPFEVADLMVSISASFGITTTLLDTAPIDVLRQADIAMSVAKERRTGLETYRSELDAGSRERLTLLTDLRRAITEGALTIWVQPKVRLRDGHVTGVEALVRWIHPEQGMIFPDDFIPAAEYSGLITPLTMTVLRQSLDACEAWHTAGHPLAIAVNLSPRSLLEPDFVNEVARALASVAVPASAVTFEITESSLMADPEPAILALGRLRDLGVRLSIDDLGTGYSSLAYLQRLPVNEIKIDRSFLQRADLDALDDSVAIIGAMVDLGHRLGREVVAEGVEDEAAWATLQKLGCDFAQGYWMSRPMPVDDFLPWLETWRPAAVAALRAVR